MMPVYFEWEFYVLFIALGRNHRNPAGFLMDRIR